MRQRITMVIGIAAVALVVATTASSSTLNTASRSGLSKPNASRTMAVARPGNAHAGIFATATLAAVVGP